MHSAPQNFEYGRGTNGVMRRTHAGGTSMQYCSELGLFPVDPASHSPGRVFFSELKLRLVMSILEHIRPPLHK